MILLIIGIILGLIILYFAIVGFCPWLAVPLQPLPRGRRPTMQTKPGQSPPRKKVSFDVKGTAVSAWLYLPEDVSKPVPCIIMGNGFGGTKDMLLDRYAIRYREAGLAVLTIDYRHFGESGGEPRQLMWIPNQLEDYAGAVEYARSLKEIDPSRIALWGTSASGGYGIVIAARDNKIACVISQCPGLDPRASRQMFMKELGIRHLLRLFVHGQRDMLRHRLHLSPHKIPIVGKPGSLAVLPVQEAYEAYSRLASETFVNEVCARVILRAHGYKPAGHLRDAGCPVLIQICDKDSLAPIGSEVEAELRKHGEVKRYPIGHFDIYAGSDFERAIRDQLDFFTRHLLASSHP